jgi:hypothetical protein
MMRVPERPEISSATLAFAGNWNIRAEKREGSKVDFAWTLMRMGEI